MDDFLIFDSARPSTRLTSSSSRELKTLRVLPLRKQNDVSMNTSSNQSQKTTTSITTLETFSGQTADSLWKQQYLFVSSGSGLNTSIRKVSALASGGLILEFAGFYTA
jgi:hypothetical protein